MLPETYRCFKAALTPCSQKTFLKELRRLSAHGGASRLPARRHFGVGRCLSGKILPPPRFKPKDRPEIPGLERVTYAERMHYVPGLAKPTNPLWERDYKDPRFYRSPPTHEMALYKEKPCHMFNQTTSLLEGVQQALWLTKTKLISGLPPHLISAAEDPANQIPDQDERVQNAIRHARFWDTSEPRPGKDIYGKTLLMNLNHLCATLRSTHPALGRRIFVEKYSLAASWKRGDDLFQIRGQNGFLLNSMDPLPVVAGKEEVEDTAEHVLKSFYPISPTIDLKQVHSYKADFNSTGFEGDYPYPHAHTVFFLELNDHFKFRAEQFRASMLMFTFGNALARAHKQYGMQPQSLLDKPVTVQAVGTNGRIFQFLVFQLNTTDMTGDDGIKNQVWLDDEVELYDFAKVRPLIKKKQVVVPAGLAGYKPQAFNKFLALHLHGAV